MQRNCLLSCLTIFPIVVNQQYRKCTVKTTKERPKVYIPKSLFEEHALKTKPPHLCLSTKNYF